MNDKIIAASLTTTFVRSCGAYKTSIYILTPIILCLLALSTHSKEKKGRGLERKLFLECNDGIQYFNHIFMNVNIFNNVFIEIIYYILRLLICLNKNTMTSHYNITLIRKKALFIHYYTISTLKYIIDHT